MVLSMLMLHKICFGYGILYMVMAGKIKKSLCLYNAKGLHLPLGIRCKPFFSV